MEHLSRARKGFLLTSAQEYDTPPESFKSRIRLAMDQFCSTVTGGGAVVWNRRSHADSISILDFPFSQTAHGILKMSKQQIKIKSMLCYVMLECQSAAPLPAEIGSQISCHPRNWCRELPSGYFHRPVSKTLHKIPIPMRSAL